jgi:hypothetical protein
MHFLNSWGITLFELTGLVISEISEITITLMFQKMVAHKACPGAIKAATLLVHCHLLAGTQLINHLTALRVINKWNFTD